MTEFKRRITSRTRARRRAAEVLYEAEQKGAINSPAQLLSLLEERKSLTAASSPLPAYAAQIVEGVAGRLPQIDALLKEHVKGSEIDRLPAVDLAVLRVGTWELIANTQDVPPITAIDEAVSVVKHISTDESPGYVNAVLDAIRKDLAAREPEVADAVEETEVSAAAETATDEVDFDEILDEY